MNLLALNVNLPTDEQTPTDRRRRMATAESDLAPTERTPEGRG